MLVGWVSLLARLYFTHTKTAVITFIISSTAKWWQDLLWAQFIKVVKLNCVLCNRELLSIVIQETVAPTVTPIIETSKLNYQFWAIKKLNFIYFAYLQRIRWY